MMVVRLWVIWFALMFTLQGIAQELSNEAQELPAGTEASGIREGVERAVLPAEKAVQGSEGSAADSGIAGRSGSVTAGTSGSDAEGGGGSVAEGGDGAAEKGEGGIKGAETIEHLRESISFTKIFWSFVLLLIGYLFIKYSVKVLDLFAERSTRIRLSFKRFIPIYRIVAWTLVLFIVIQGVISPSWEAVVALGASVGVAVGFAAQDILKNIFGGITVLAEKPFQVGDKIDVGDHYGEVLHIGFRSTRIVTADDSTVTIPNAELTSKAVSNANYGENNCQVVAEIYLPPDVDTGAVRKIAMEAAQVSSLVYLRKPVSVQFVHELKEQRPFLKMRLKAYVLDIRHEFSFKSEMTEIVLHELYKQGIIRKEEA
ncbi:MAG: mechanosensitive ion channel domain-containing protein [Bacteroidales bacterium]